MTVKEMNMDDLSVAAIRTLAIDAVEKAKSGHPGMPMGAAPMGYHLFVKVMTHNPKNPTWINRDRFVLSAGHGSMLLYSLLHLSGYDLPMEEIKNFRQWKSKTPGHPEFGHTAGVDATTGPLGQGIAMAVGMAMAEAQLRATYNRDNYFVIDHYTYVICGDGDMMEGVSNEAASLAGHLQLGKLIVLYDSNNVTLDAEASLSFSESVRQRHEAYGWQTMLVEDGNDLTAIAQAVEQAKQNISQPTLIEVKTIIGYGSPNKQGKSGHGGTHGSPLGTEEVKLTKKFYNWGHGDFFVPEQVYKHFDVNVKQRGIRVNEEWNAMFQAYKRAYPEQAKQFETAIHDQLPEDWDVDLPTYFAEDKALSTRVASGNVLNRVAKNIPHLIGGSADLESSTMTHMNGLATFRPNQYDGRNIYFGVREFAMAAAMNGMALHTGVKVFGGTFFVFTDYLRPAMRLSALMGLPVIYVLTHDSIAVGEDGPTHEPIEQLASVRIIPNVTVIRPADANETSAAWACALQNQRYPVVLVLTRQNLPILAGSVDVSRKGVACGAYVVSDAQDSKPQAQIIATGSEVQLAVRAQQALKEEGIQVRIISMPSWNLFEKQSKEYKDSVLLPDVKARLAVEMAYPFGWERYVGDQGDIIGISRFGASAPGDCVVSEYGFTVENVVNRLKALL